MFPSRCFSLARYPAAFPTRYSTSPSTVPSPGPASLKNASLLASSSCRTTTPTGPPGSISNTTDSSLATTSAQCASAAVLFARVMWIV